MKQPLHRLYRQQGIAMLTAVMLAALAITIVSTIYVQQRYSIRLAHNIQDMEQAYQYAYSAEQLAGVWLERDLQQNGPDSPDSLLDEWALERKPLPLTDESGEPIGELQVEIEDLQAYFNVNNVYDAKEKKPREFIMAAFKRLLQIKGLPPTYANSVLDWVDEDELVSDPESAESDYYLLLTPAYRAANAFLADAGELGQIKMGNIEDAEEKQTLLAALLPSVIALPTPTSLNVNTAGRDELEAVGLTAAQADALVNIRKGVAINDQAALNSSVPGIAAEAMPALGYKSNYFRLSGQVRLGKSRLFLNSVLFRPPEGKVRVILRQFARVARPAAKDDQSDTTIN